jgi:hypothetical protein
MPKRYTPTWGKGWTGPYEGPFTLALKSAWANLPTTAGTSALFNGQSFGHGWQVQSSASLLSRPPDRGGEWADRCLSHYAGDWTFELASDQHFRFCPDCLRQGYQASIYQIQALRLCPIHFRELTTKCMRCGALTCAYSLNQAAFGKPFHCWHCSEVWVEGLSLRSLSNTDELHAECEQRLADLYRWLSSLQKVEIVDRRKGSRSGCGSDGWYRTIDPDCRLLERMGVDRRIAGFWIATRLSHMLLDADLFVKLNQRLAFAGTVVGGNSEQDSRDDHLASFIPIYKSIRRHIEKTYLKRCGCEIAIDMQSSSRRRMPRKVPHLLKPSFAIWRRRFELTLDFDLYKRVQRSWSGYLRTDNSLSASARRCRFFYAASFLKWYGNDRDLRWPIELLPSMVLSNFFSLCNEVKALMDETIEDQTIQRKHDALDIRGATDSIWLQANLHQRILESTEFPEQITGPYFGIGDMPFQSSCSQVVLALTYSSLAAIDLAKNWA